MNEQTLHETRRYRDLTTDVRRSMPLLDSIKNNLIQAEVNLGNERACVTCRNVREKFRLALNNLERLVPEDDKEKKDYRSSDNLNRSVRELSTYRGDNIEYVEGQLDTVVKGISKQLERTTGVLLKDRQLMQGVVTTLVSAIEKNIEAEYQLNEKDKNDLAINISKLLVDNPSLTALILSNLPTSNSETNYILSAEELSSLVLLLESQQNIRNANPIIGMLRGGTKLSPDLIQSLNAAERKREGIQMGSSDNEALRSLIKSRGNETQEVLDHHGVLYEPLGEFKRAQREMRTTIDEIYDRREVQFGVMAHTLLALAVDPIIQHIEKRIGTEATDNTRQLADGLQQSKNDITKTLRSLATQTSLPQRIPDIIGLEKQISSLEAMLRTDQNTDGQVTEQLISAAGTALKKLRAAFNVFSEEETAAHYDVVAGLSGLGKAGEIEQDTN